MGVFLAADVGRDGAFELGLAQLLENGGAEHGIFQGRGAQADQGVFVAAFEALLVRLGHPEGQHAQHAAGLLEPGQLLPFAFEDGDGGGVEGVGGGELLAGAVEGEPVGQLLAVVNNPVAVFVAGFEGVLGKHDLAFVGDGALVPLEQPAADDFGRFGLGGHDDGLAEAVEHLLEALVVGLVFGRHFELGGGDGHRQHDVVEAARDFGEVVEEVVELGAEAALAVSADVVHQLVQEDETGLVFGEEAGG